MTSRPALLTGLIFGLNLLVWGYNWVPVHYMLLGTGPATASAIRVVGGTATLFALLVAMRRPLGPPPGRSFIWIGLIQVTGSIGLATVAMLYGGVSRSAILLFTMPFWAMLIARVAFKERVGTQRWTALAIAVFGLGCIASEALTNVSTIVGALCAIGAGLAWAIGVILSRKAGAGADLLRSVAWQQLAGSIPLVLIAVVLREPLPVTIGPEFALATLFAALIGSGMGWLLWSASVARISPPVLALGSLGIPLIASLAAFFQLHQVPDQRTFVGLVAILLALFVANVPLPPRRERARGFAGLPAR